MEKNLNDLIEDVEALLTIKKDKRAALKEELNNSFNAKQKKLIAEMNQLHFEVTSLNLMLNSTYGHIKK